MRGGLGHAQDHGVAGSDKERADAVGARASREQHKTATEEWMTGVCDFHFSQVVYQWVVDRGMKLYDRSTASTMMLYWPKRRASPAIRRQRKAWLKAGILEDDHLSPTTAGTLQGGSCSPL